MKKNLLVILLLTLIFIFSACNRVEEESTPELAYPPTGDETYVSEESEESEVVGTPRPFPGNGVLDYASEEEMAYYSDAPRFSWTEEGIWMKFYFERPVSDVVYVGSPMVGYDEELGLLLFSRGEVLFEAGDLPAGQPVFVQTIGIFGTTPAQAIGLTYEDGIRYYIPFIQCQKDGDLLLLINSAFTFSE